MSITPPPIDIPWLAGRAPFVLTARRVDGTQPRQGGRVRRWPGGGRWLAWSMLDARAMLGYSYPYEYTEECLIRCIMSTLPTICG